MLSEVSYYSFLFNPMKKMSREISQKVQNAITLRDTHQLRFILSDDTFNVNDRLRGGDYDGYTPLQFAIVMQSVRCFKLLLEHPRISVLPRLPDGRDVAALFQNPFSRNTQRILDLLRAYLDEIRPITPRL